MKDSIEQIMKDFPELYSDVRAGFEVDEGWLPIIRRLSTQLNDKVRCDQVKEKFGTLRFYVHNCTDEGYQHVLEAEEESAKTCEKCGEPGRLRSGRWIKTLCDDHAEERYGSRT